MKSGINTTEFWITLIATMGAAGIALAVSYGLLNNEQAAAWQGLIAALAPLLAVVVVGWLAKSYGDNRTQLKAQATEALLESTRLEAMPGPVSVPSVWHLGAIDKEPVKVTFTSTSEAGEWTWFYAPTNQELDDSWRYSGSVALDSAGE